MGRLKQAYIASDLPREKAAREGISSLNDSELVALLLDTGSRKENVVSLSTRLLYEKGGLRGLFLSDLPVETYGVKSAKSFRLLAVKEIMKRIPLQPKDEISSSLKAYEKTKMLFLNQKTEISVFLYLDRKKQLNYLQTFDLALPHASLVPIEKIVKTALLTSSCFVIMLHNHPSGELTPSNKDVEKTTVLHNSLSQIGVLLLDSIIVKEESFLSFRQEKRSPYC